jgi:hypothetical protein
MFAPSGSLIRDKPRFGNQMPGMVKRLPVQSNRHGFVFLYTERARPSGVHPATHTDMMLTNSLMP